MEMYTISAVKKPEMTSCVPKRKYFKINSDIDNINTRNSLDLHYLQSQLSVYQKVAHYTGMKVFSRLPVPI
jgi:hypothetical protein